MPWHLLIFGNLTCVVYLGPVDHVLHWGSSRTVGCVHWCPCLKKWKTHENTIIQTRVWKVLTVTWTCWSKTDPCVKIFWPHANIRSAFLACFKMNNNGSLRDWALPRTMLRLFSSKPQSRKNMFPHRTLSGCLLQNLVAKNLMRSFWGKKSLRPKISCKNPSKALTWISIVLLLSWQKLHLKMKNEAWNGH